MNWKDKRWGCEIEITKEWQLLVMTRFTTGLWECRGGRMKEKKSLKNKNSKKQMYQAIGKIIFAYTEITKNLDSRRVGGNYSDP